MSLLYEPWPGCETLEYRAPDGESVRFLMRSGRTGAMMPPAKLTTLAVPGGPGSRFLGAFATERVVAVPVVFPGTLTDREELRRWAHVLDPSAGEGVLAVVDGPWAGREIPCAYDSGFDGLDEEEGSFNLGALVFRAAWPYWRDGSESSITAGDQPATHSWFPFLPLTLGPSSAFVQETLTNDGDGPAWPVVTVLGPATEVVVANETTGQSWHITGGVPTGSLLVVDHRPGYKTATVDGVSVFARLTTDSVLFGLAPGVNEISMQASGTARPGTTLRFAWRRQWLAA